MNTRRARIQLIYNNTDISQDVSGDLISFEWTDNESGKADDLNVTLKDERGLWIGPWFPGKGDTLQASIIDEGYGEVYCGRFQIDDLTASGPPRQLQIKAASVPLDAGIRRLAKSRAWEDVQLSRIAGEIAEIGNLRLIYDVSHDPRFDRIDQREESDLAFLDRLCKSEGYSLKVTDAQMVVFDQQLYEAGDPIATITYGVDGIEAYNFESQAFDLYKECEVTYFDPETEETITNTFPAPNVAEGMTMKLVKRASSFAEAERMARAELRRKNRHEITASLTITGDLNLVSGATIVVSGFGRYNGKYIIESVTHSVGSGYTTRLKLRRVLEGY